MEWRVRQERGRNWFKFIVSHGERLNEREIDGEKK